MGAFTNSWAIVSLEGPPKQKHKVPKTHPSLSTRPGLVYKRAARLWSPCYFPCFSRHTTLPRSWQQVEMLGPGGAGGENTAVLTLEHTYPFNYLCDLGQTTSASWL